MGRNACRRDASRPATPEPGSPPHRPVDPVPEVPSARHRAAAPAFCSGPVIEAQGLFQDRGHVKHIILLILTNASALV